LWQTSNLECSRRRRVAGFSVTLLKKLGNTMAWDAEKSSKQQGMKSKKSFTLIS